MASETTRRHYGRRAGVRESAATQRAAAQLGVSALVLGQDVRTRGVHIRTAALIQAAAETGDDRLYAVLTTEILAAMEQRPRLPLLQILDQAQMIDLREDMAEHGHLCNPHDVASVRAHLGLARQQFTSTLDLIRALEVRLEELTR